MTLLTSRSGTVLVTGGSGYIGTRLIEQLLADGYPVRAIVRAQSVRKLPPGCEPIIGDVLDTAHVAVAMRTGDTLVQLVGTAHPSPAKAPLFRSVDLASAKAAFEAARLRSAAHVVYVSVAHPAPVMQAYVAARVEAETYLRASNLPATILRPWYVLGPGHQWPHLLRPAYALAERIPSWSDGARRLGLVTVAQMVHAIAWSVAHPVVQTEVSEPRIIDVPDIRRLAQTPATALDARRVPVY